MLIDTHCHLENLEVLERARKAGVQKLINIGCDIATTQAACDFAKQETDVFFTAGIHPHEASQAPKDYLEHLSHFAQDPKCVAIGECGLDFYYNHSNPDTQKKVFQEQIALAKKLNQTLVIHVRDAYEDCLNYLKADQTIVIHCFSGNRNHASAFLDLGCYLSISGIVTFKNAQELCEVVKETSLKKLLLETDSPWLAPMPYRGKPNEPAYVRLVAEKVAELKKISLEEVIEQTGRNALEVFRLPD